MYRTVWLSGEHLLEALKCSTLKFSDLKKFFHKVILHKKQWPSAKRNQFFIEFRFKKKFQKLFFAQKQFSLFTAEKFGRKTFLIFLCH